MSIIAGFMAPLGAELMEARTNSENVRVFLTVTDQTRREAAGTGTWDQAYAMAFGGPLGEAARRIFAGMGMDAPKWSDPDADYEDDVLAWLDSVDPAMQDYLKGHDLIMASLGEKDGADQ